METRGSPGRLYDDIVEQAEDDTDRLRCIIIWREGRMEEIIGLSFLAISVFLAAATIHVISDVWTLYLAKVG